MTQLRLWALGVLFLVPGPLNAQIGPQWPDPAAFISNPVASQTALAQCVTEVEHSPQEVVEELSCTVVGVDTVIVRTGPAAVAVRYERWIKTSLSWADSTQVDEVLLFDLSDGGTLATPVWRRVGFDYFLGPFETGRFEEHDLVQLYSCVRGTGGCVEEVLVRGAEGWAGVELAFLAELEPHLPAGYALHKGRRIDLTTLDFDQPIAGPDDPNCCPSASLVGRTRLEGTMLRLVDVRLEPRGANHRD